MWTQENRWKKRGFSVVLCRYPIDYFATNLPASIAVYHMDGHIAVSHGGIEMGQGLNTKVALHKKDKNIYSKFQLYNIMHELLFTCFI